MYYHIKIELKSDKHELGQKAFQSAKKSNSQFEEKFDQSEEKLVNQIISRFEDNESIFFNGKTIHLDDIERIKIIRTESVSTTIFLERVSLRYEAWELQPSVTWEAVANEGEDVTDDFIQKPPGNKKRTSKEYFNSKPQSNQIFVVHGHNEEMKQAVARTLEKLDLKPIILHEQPNQGRTIIEKFTEYADGVSFAIVLLSPDDKGFKRDQSLENAKFRARQNVILELGFFLGKLGRNNVAALFKNDPDFERPSDYDGVMYTPFDNSGRWQFDLVRELKSAGYDVDANRLLS